MMSQTCSAWIHSELNLPELIESSRRGLEVVIPFLEGLTDNGSEPHGTSASHLIKLAKEGFAREDLPNDKSGRWFGFIIGVLTHRQAGVDLHLNLTDDIPAPVVSTCRLLAEGLMPVIYGMSDDEVSNGIHCSDKALVTYFADRIHDKSIEPAMVNFLLGHLQGVLIARGDLDMDEERNRTRPSFHSAYRQAGIEPPPSIAVGGRG